MAFFTRSDLAVSPVGEEDVVEGDPEGMRSESSTLTRGETLIGADEGEGEVSSSDEEADGDARTVEECDGDSRTVEGRESPQNQIYDYVVDRTFGVQV